MGGGFGQSTRLTGPATRTGHRRSRLWILLAIGLVAIFGSWLVTRDLPPFFPAEPIFSSRFGEPEADPSGRYVLLRERAEPVDGVTPAQRLHIVDLEGGSAAATGALFGLEASGWREATVLAVQTRYDAWWRLGFLRAPNRELLRIDVGGRVVGREPWPYVELPRDFGGGFLGVARQPDGEDGRYSLVGYRDGATSVVGPAQREAEFLAGPRGVLLVRPNGSGSPTLWFFDPAEPGARAGEWEMAGEVALRGREVVSLAEAVEGLDLPENDAPARVFWLPLGEEVLTVGDRPQLYAALDCSRGRGDVYANWDGTWRLVARGRPLDRETCANPLQATSFSTLLRAGLSREQRVFAYVGDQGVTVVDLQSGLEIPVPGERLASLRRVPGLDGLVVVTRTGTGPTCRASYFAVQGGGDVPIELATSACPRSLISVAGDRLRWYDRDQGGVVETGGDSADRWLWRGLGADAG